MDNSGPAYRHLKEQVKFPHCTSKSVDIKVNRASVVAVTGCFQIVTGKDRNVLPYKFI